MTDISIMIKPASYNCNLRCSYCFYNDELNHRVDKESFIMSNETIDNIIKKTDSFSDGGFITYIFQGGEPLLAGIEYYYYFCEKAYEISGDRVSFNVQTNGTLLNDDYCKLFKKYDFLVGVSLDGPETLHNINRNNTYEKVFDSIKLLKDYEIEFNILSVITKFTDPYELYNFYKVNGFKDVQTIYCLDCFDGTKNDFSLDSKSYVRFRKRFFNCWFKDIETDDYIHVRDLENLINMIYEDDCYAYEQCGMIGECSPNIVVEADGKCYPCDFYCIDDFYCVNINDSDLHDMLKCKGMKKFLSYETVENKLCKNCYDYLFCKSGCKRIRYLFNEIDGYCPQRDFLDYVFDKTGVDK